MIFFPTLPSNSQVTVSKIEYRGYTNAIKIANSKIEAVIVPQVGRILRFGRVGGPNMLFESDFNSGGWANIGGDKLWPAPQSLWNWPPEKAYDSTPWSVSFTHDAVTMKSMVPGEKTGVLFERTVHLDSRTLALDLDNVVINRSKSMVKTAVWEVCQVPNPDYCVLPATAGKWRCYDPIDVSGLARQETDTVRFVRDPKRGIKYGCASPAGYVEAKLGSMRLRLSAPFIRGAEYVDKGLAQQLYMSADPERYAELEITGPLKQLLPGGELHLKTRLIILQ